MRSRLIFLVAVLLTGCTQLEAPRDEGGPPPLEPAPTRPGPGETRHFDRLFPLRTADAARGIILWSSDLGRETLVVVRDVHALAEKEEVPGPVRAEDPAGFALMPNGQVVWWRHDGRTVELRRAGEATPFLSFTQRPDGAHSGVIHGDVVTNGLVFIGPKADGAPRFENVIRLVRDGVVSDGFTLPTEGAVVGIDARGSIVHMCLSVATGVAYAAFDVESLDWARPPEPVLVPSGAWCQQVRADAEGNVAIVTDPATADVPPGGSYFARRGPLGWEVEATGANVVNSAGDIRTSAPAMLVQKSGQVLSLYTREDGTWTASRDHDVRGSENVFFLDGSQDAVFLTSASGWPPYRVERVG